MDYISLVSVEEQLTICDLIGGQLFRNLFIENSKIFNKIKPGFRANKLTDIAALETAKRAIHNVFIRNHINLWIDSAMHDISNCILNFESQGKSHYEALASTLIDSFFINHISLYIKLSGEEVSEEQLKYITESIKKEQEEREKASDAENKISELKQEVKNLQEQLKHVQQAWEDDCAHKDQIISEYEQKNAELIKQLNAATNKISKIESMERLTSTEISDNQQLILFEDTAPVGLPMPGSEYIVSLCEVYVNYSGSVRLIRRADVDNKGKLSLFYKDETKPPLFENRDKLYQMDGPTDSRLYAIWNWSTHPNLNDPTKDYVETKYNPAINPIEIVVMTEYSSIEKAVSALKSGYKCEIRCRKIMFSVYTGKGKYVGILCNNKDIISEMGTISFADTVIQVPIYEFDSNDVIKIENGSSFYKSVFAGMPVKLYRVKSLIEVVKDIVLNSISWTSCKQRGIAKAEYRCFKDLISSLPTKDIIDNICSVCHCGKELASELLEQFITNINKYITEESLEDTIVLSAINSNDSMMNRAKSLIKSDWEKENSDIILLAQSEFEAITHKVDAATHELSIVQQSYTKIKEAKDKLLKEIAEKEQLAIDVEASVADRIRHAQENVSDFIANMAFVASPTIKVEPANYNASSTSAISATYDIVCRDMDGVELEPHKSWHDVIETTIYELEAAGISSKYSKSFATYLCAAFIAKEPIMLVGPNAKDIIEAFNTSLFGNKYGLLQCEGAFSSDTFNAIGHYDEHVVLIINLFSDGWINRIPEIFTKKDVLFVVTHPFAEDIQVEPKSIYNYLLPLFTDFFVDKNPSGSYSGGYFADDFKEYIPKKMKNREPKYFSRLPANNLIKNKIKNILTIMHNLHSEMTGDDDFMFGIFQYAYATMNMEIINDIIGDSNNSISRELKSEMQILLGDGR